MASNELNPHPHPQSGPGAHALALRQSHALQTEVLAARQGQDGGDDDEIDLRAIWRTLLKHKAMIGGITLLAVLAAGIYTLRATPLYQATVMLQIDRAAQKVVGFNSEVEVDQGAASDQLQLRTQIELLKSRSLAERVIDELNLFRPNRDGALPGQDATSENGRAADDGLPGDDPEATEPSMFERMARNFTQLFSPASSDEQVLGREETLNGFNQSVTVEPVRNSRLVEVQVLNSSPELAARIANQMAKAAIAMNLERKTESSVYARQYLEDQIKQTKAKLEASERQINEYAKNNNILNLGDKGSATTQTFVDFSGALAKAEQDRIRAEAQYNEIRLNPESAPQVFANVAIQTYKEQKAKLEAEYAKNLAVFKPEFPAMVQAKAQIDQLQARIDDEVNTTLRSIKGQYEAARQQEASLRAKVAASKADVQSVQDRSVDLNLLQRELDTNRQVYDSLLQRLKEVSVTANITTNNLSVVDAAKVPLFPHKPKPLINLGLGLVLGLFLGMLAALLREQMDDSIKHADEVESLFGLPLLGWIPMTRTPKGVSTPIAMQVQSDPRGAFAEAYRSMRTALQFSTPEGAPKRFMVTSCSKSEGKSTTAIALAINFAQLGQRVLLIDADMRKASVHKTLRLPNERGLSNLLSGDMAHETLIQTTSIPGLAVMTAGPTPPDPVELLMGPKLMLFLNKAEEMGFSQVIVDGPPLLGLADSLVLGNQIQHIVFALKAGETKRNVIKDSLRRMRTAGLMPMGVVLTHAKDEHAPGYGYGYQSYYGYGEEPSRSSSAQPTVPDELDGVMGGGHGGGPRLGKPKGPVVAAASAAGLVLIGLLAWVLWPVSEPEAPSSVAKGVVSSDVSPQAPVATASVAVAPPPAAESSPDLSAGALSTPSAESADLKPAKPPALASLKDSPADTWPMLGSLWNARFEPQGACDNVIAVGLQCFRMPKATVAELRLMDRPGLVQLRDGSTERWVLLSRVEGEMAFLRSGDLTWSVPLKSFEEQWTGAFTTVWRLPPNHKTRVFAARANDPAGRWLDEQLKKMPEARGESYEARVLAFQQAHKLPGDGKALPSTFVLVNRMVNRDEPRLQ